MRIRPAQVKDLEELFSLGKNTPELRTSATEEFMDKEELKWCIANPECVFLVAEEDQKLCGFIYANAKDKERPFPNKYACLVYLAVLPEFRKKGVATLLYEECEKKLKEMGINWLYGWAKADGVPILSFLEGRRFQKGQEYVWMDKRL